jgi:hypothetical protein
VGVFRRDAGDEKVSLESKDWTVERRRKSCYRVSARQSRLYRQDGPVLERRLFPDPGMPQLDAGDEKVSLESKDWTVERRRKVRDSEFLAEPMSLPMASGRGSGIAHGYLVHLASFLAQVNDSGGLHTRLDRREATQSP